MKTDVLNTYDHIRLEAFLLSEKAGHPTGMDETFWTQAEAIVQGRTAVVAGAGKASPVKAKASPAVKSKKQPAAPKAVAQPPPKVEAPAKAKAKPAAKRSK